MSIRVFGIGIPPFITYVFVLEIAKTKQKELSRNYELNIVNRRFHHPRFVGENLHLQLIIHP